MLVMESVPPTVNLPGVTLTEYGLPCASESEVPLASSVTEVVAPAGAVERTGTSTTNTGRLGIAPNHADEDSKCASTCCWLTFA